MSLGRFVSKYLFLKNIRRGLGQEVSIDTGRGVITGRLVSVSEDLPLKLRIRNAVVEGDSAPVQTEEPAPEK